MDQHGARRLKKGDDPRRKLKHSATHIYESPKNSTSENWMANFSPPPVPFEYEVEVTEKEKEEMEK